MNSYSILNTNYSNNHFSNLITQTNSTAALNQSLQAKQESVLLIQQQIQYLNQFLDYSLAPSSVPPAISATDINFLKELSLFVSNIKSSVSSQFFFESISNHQQIVLSTKLSYYIEKSQAYLLDLQRRYQQLFYHDKLQNRISQPILSNPQFVSTQEDSQINGFPICPIQTTLQQQKRQFELTPASPVTRVIDVGINGSFDSLPTGFSNEKFPFVMGNQARFRVVKESQLLNNQVTVIQSISNEFQADSSSTYQADVIHEIENQEKNIPGSHHENSESNIMTKSGEWNKNSKQKESNELREIDDEIAPSANKFIENRFVRVEEEIVNLLDKLNLQEAKANIIILKASLKVNAILAQNSFFFKNKTNLHIACSILLHCSKLGGYPITLAAVMRVLPEKKERSILKVLNSLVEELKGPIYREVIAQISSSLSHTDIVTKIKQYAQEFHVEKETQTIAACEYLYNNMIVKGFVKGIRVDLLAASIVFVCAALNDSPLEFSDVFQSLACDSMEIISPIIKLILENKSELINNHKLFKNQNSLSNTQSQQFISIKSTI